MPKSAKELEQEERNLYDTLRREFWESAALTSTAHFGTLMPPELAGRYADRMLHEWEMRFPFVATKQEKSRVR